MLTPQQIANSPFKIRCGDTLVGFDGRSIVLGFLQKKTENGLSNFERRFVERRLILDGKSRDVEIFDLGVHPLEHSGKPFTPQLALGFDCSGLRDKECDLDGGGKHEAAWRDRQDGAPSKNLGSDSLLTGSASLQGCTGEHL